MKFLDAQGREHDRIRDVIFADAKDKLNALNDTLAYAANKRLEQFQQSRTMEFASSDYPDPETEVNPFIADTFDDMEETTSTSANPIQHTVTVVQTPEVNMEEQVVEPTVAAESETEVEPATEGEVNSEPAPAEAPQQTYSRIDIDYAHGKLRLLDENDHVLGETDIDPNLVKGTIDAQLMSVLYPNGKVPDHVSSNIESIKQISEDAASDTSDMDGIAIEESATESDTPVG